MGWQKEETGKYKKQEVLGPTGLGIRQESPMSSRQWRIKTELAWSTEDSLSPDALPHRPRMKRVGHFLGGEVALALICKCMCPCPLMNRSEVIQPGNLWDLPAPNPQC